MRTDDNRRDLMHSVDGRRREIGQAILARIRAIRAETEIGDPEYLEGQRSAVESAIDHTIRSSRNGDSGPLPVPVAILTQARLAAHRKVPLETVLRRYLAGHSVLGDFVLEEAERRRVAPAILRRILRSQAAETDRVLAVISTTYLQELDRNRLRSGERRLTDGIRRLLDGELLDPASLSYGFDRWHIGLVIRAADASPAIGALARRLDLARLAAVAEDGATWAWLGSPHTLDSDTILGVLSSELSGDWTAGIGEPGHGMSGWRLTHRQAQAAFSVAIRREGGAARYADVAVLASAIKDELLTLSLHTLYLDPLGEKAGEGVLHGTLRAYLSADRNVTSAAATLGVSRNTVTNRLRTIEARIGQLRPSRIGPLGLALELGELRRPKSPI